MPRENANGARAKSGGRTVPVGPALIRLYADYLHGEYGGVRSATMSYLDVRIRHVVQNPELSGLCSRELVLTRKFLLAKSG